MVAFSEEERKKLSPYVSNIRGNVFVASVPGLTGAIYARYSRASGGFREVMLNEFIKTGQLDVQRADKLIEKILVGWGDDSVGELEGVHLSIEQVSNLATKVIEDKRIGGSPIEQSSRYVFYDQKDEQGNFRFFREPRIMASEHAQSYEETLNFCFETYCDLIEPMQTYFRKLLPLEEAEFKIRESWNRKKRLHELTDQRERQDFEKTYRETIRTRACDTIRVVLPTATLTNLGVFGNGRFFQGLLTELYSSQYQEMRELARNIHVELDQYVRRYVQRARENDYIKKNRENMQNLANKLFCGINPKHEDPVVLLDNPTDKTQFLDFTITNMLFQYVEHPTRQIREIVSQLDHATRKTIVATYVGDRQTKRDRPGRGLEFGYPLTFDLIGNFGIYRDLHRHRMLTQQRQRLTTGLGFSVPSDIKEAGFEEIVLTVEDKMSFLHKRLKSIFPDEAQYATLFGHNIRWNIGINPREGIHMLELRTIPQGHQDYRAVCQRMHTLIRERDPEIADLMSFVDHKQYPFSRADSEAKIRAKEHQIEK